MRSQVLSTTVLVAATFIVCTATLASGVTNITHAVIAAGGLGGSSTHSSVRTTLGQTAAIAVASAHHAIHPGFWWPGQIPSDLSEQEVLPSDFALRSVFPNPFSRTTEIRYDIPPHGGNVSLRIYDVRGRLIRDLVRGTPASGTQRTLWNGTDDSGRRVGPGLYLLSFVAPGRESTRKLVLLP
jgi:hypothetical protein